MRIVTDPLGRNTMYFHTDIRFSLKQMTSDTELTPGVTCKLIGALYELPGVQYVYVDRFKIRIEKSMAVEWKEIQNQITALIEQAGKDGNIV